MSIWYPKLSRRRLQEVLRITLLGIVIAGAYGAVHDQISYSISTEYFTKLKFRQFDYADFGLPPRVFAAEVGFLATWWVGLIAGWLVARLGLAELTEVGQRRPIVVTFAIVIGTTAVGGGLGTLLGLLATGDGNLHGWTGYQARLELRDVRAFVIVAYLHLAGYAGAVLGLVCAVIYVRRRLACWRRTEARQA